MKSDIKKEKKEDKEYNKEELRRLGIFIQKESKDEKEKDTSSV